jgi:hypothetical protein
MMLPCRMQQNEILHDSLQKKKKKTEEYQFTPELKRLNLYTDITNPETPINIG